MFWEHLYKLCDEKGCKPNTVAKAIGLSTATATKWKNGAIPNGEALSKIADYLDCSVDYLLGRTDNPNIYQKGISNNVVNSGNNSIAIGNNIGNTNSSFAITNNDKNSNSNLCNDEHQEELMKIYNSLSTRKQIELISFAFKLEENEN